MAPPLHANSQSHRPQRHSPRRHQPSFPQMRAMPLPLLLLLPLVLAQGFPAIDAAPAPCPKRMSCIQPVRGFFQDPPGGFLRTAFTGLGPDQPDSCSQLCRRTKGCAYWMYYALKPEGECKMWTHDQGPCTPQNPRDPASTVFDPDASTDTVVGGPCVSALPAAAPPVEYVKGPCPRLHCHSPRKGFLWDHKEKGHLLRFMTGRKKKPMPCYEQCRETPGCAFWMFNMGSDLGECKLWRADQSPCAPEPGSDDRASAHFDANPAHGSYVVGGYCKIPRTDYEDIVD